MSKGRVAIIGASGVGKHHAKWFHLAGCEVVAFLGTSAETCEKTKAGLREIFPFDGKTYTDLEDMLDTERLDMISICSPPHLHADHIIRSLDAGCHVLCEKPLHWMPGKSLSEHESDLRRIAEAQAKTRPFAVNLQFASCCDAYRDIYKEIAGDELGIPKKFAMEWTPRPGKTRAPEWFWNDLGPHALSVLMKLVPGAELTEDQFDCRVTSEGTKVRFIVRSDEDECAVDLNLTPPPNDKVVRRLGANDIILDYSARGDESGMFHTYFNHGNKEWKFEDFMKASIERFISWTNGDSDAPYVTGDEAAANLRMQLKIFESAVVES